MHRSCRKWWYIEVRKGVIHMMYGMMGYGMGAGLWCLIPMALIIGGIYLAVRYGVKHGMKH